MSIKYISHFNLKITKRQQEEVIYKYKNGKQSIKSLAKEYHSTHYNISKLLKLNNVEKHPTGYFNSKYTLDDTVLDNIDTEEKAYFLGFFYADGYNYRTKHKIKIVLAEQDKEILYEFKKLFKTDRPILTYQNKGINDQLSHMLIITSKKLSKRLTELGADQAKSYKIRFPEFLCENLIKHFIRGYFDGDGCVCLSIVNNAYININIISNKLFIEDLSQILTKFELKHNIRPEKRNTKLSYITINKSSNCEIFLNWLYNDANIFLQRKYNKFLEFKIERKAYELQYDHIHGLRSGKCNS